MKKHIIILLSLCFLLLFMTAGIVFKADPYYYYRVEADEDIYLTNKFYQNPGMLRNYDYTSVITGSSMTDNFNYTLFNELFNTRTLKAPFSGALSKNIELVLDLAFSNKEKIDNVFLGLDIHMLVGSPTKYRGDVPKYLLKFNPINVSYLFDKNVVSDIYKKSKVNGGNLEKAYNWADKSVFSKEAALKMYERTPEILEIKVKTFYDDLVKQNWSNILPYIQNNKDTNFYIFFPPYSILYWEDTYRRGNLDAYIYIEQTIIKQLLEYENVKVFYYQDLESIVLNLDNYEDYSHYSPEINTYMTKTMANGDHRLTKENYLEKISNLKKTADEYIQKN